MDLKRLVTTVLLTAPLFTFAATTQPCAVSPATNAYWARQYASLIAHGTSALHSGDIDDARKSLDTAVGTIPMTCPATLNHLGMLKLDKELAQVDIDTAMLDAAKSIAKRDYVEARQFLNNIAAQAQSHGVKIPEGQPILLKTANEGYVEYYFAGLDKAVTDKRITPEAAAVRERDACQKIQKMEITMPERCNRIK